MEYIGPDIVARAIKKLDASTLASILDHTLLDPKATYSQLKDFLETAVIYNMNVCINEGRLRDAVKILNEDLGGSGIRISAVAAFPFGATATPIKVATARYLYENGAHEVDVVANVGYLKDRDSRYKEELMEIADVAAEYNGVLKVIIETAYLDIGDKVEATKAIKEIGREKGINVFVKTSTGYATPPPGVQKGATVEDVHLIRETLGEIGNGVGIKASGGIRDIDTAVRMIYAAGLLDKRGNLKIPPEELMWAFRIGTSSGHKIMKQFLSIKGEE